MGNHRHQQPQEPNLESPRYRREWTDELSDYDRALYIDAVETAIERGYHDRFAKWHAHPSLHLLAHDTCAFFLWHRRFTYTYETMLRSLGPKRYQSISIPYWNIARDFVRQQRIGGCREYGGCSPIVYDIGGKSVSFGDTAFEHRSIDQIEEVGWVHRGPPLQNYYDSNASPGIVRLDMEVERIPLEASLAALVELFDEDEWLIQKDIGTRTIAFWRRLQVGVHDHVHDSIGGFMRRAVSPVDPLFFPWHATLDLLGQFWEACHFGSGANRIDVDLDDGDRYYNFVNDTSQESNLCLYTEDVRQNLTEFRFNSDDAWFVNFTASDQKDDLATSWAGYIEDDPVIGQFCSPNSFTQPYCYSSKAFAELQAILANDTNRCPLGLSNWSCQGMDNLEDNDDVAMNSTSQYTEFVFDMKEITSIKKEWMLSAELIWANDTEKQAKLRKVECLLENLDRDTLERWAIDDVFVPYIVKQEMSVFHPFCQFSTPSGTSEVSENAGSATSRIENASPSLYLNILLMPLVVVAIANWLLVHS